VPKSVAERPYFNQGDENRDQGCPRSKAAEYIAPPVRAQEHTTLYRRVDWQWNSRAWLEPERLPTIPVGRARLADVPIAR